MTAERLGILPGRERAVCPGRARQRGVQQPVGGFTVDDIGAWRRGEPHLP